MTELKIQMDDKGKINVIVRGDNPDFMKYRKKFKKNLKDIRGF